MSESKSLKLFLVVLMVAIVMMASSPNWGVDARYLPTRSDPLTPVGPPRGEDLRFDRLYDIIRELLRNESGDSVDDIGHKTHLDGRY